MGMQMRLHSLADLKILKSMAMRGGTEQPVQLGPVTAAPQPDFSTGEFARAVGPLTRMPASVAPFHKSVSASPVRVVAGARYPGFFHAAATLPPSRLEGDFHGQVAAHAPSAEIARKLRKGYWRVQRQIDLHGLFFDEACGALNGFVEQSHQMGVRCVRVVHGKGLNSANHVPVLKNWVPVWLVQKPQVLAFTHARPAEGGTGALLVLLKAVRSQVQ